MKPLRVLAALLVGGCLVLAGCSSNGSSSATYTFHGSQKIGALIKPADRKPVHDFSGSGLSGGTFKLTQDAGKVTVVNFWGAWCGPCQVETPQFGLVYDAYKAKNVAFVGIDVKEGSRAKPRAFVKENAIHYPIVYDEDGETAIRMGNIPTQFVPLTVVLDKQHRVAAVYIVRLAPNDLEPVLNKLIAEK
jgi:thiol-disulfide isomerase/thioredoxin